MLRVFALGFSCHCAAGPYEEYTLLMPSVRTDNSTFCKFAFPGFTRNGAEGQGVSVPLPSAGGPAFVYTQGCQ